MLCVALPKTHETHLKYHVVIAKPPFTVKMIDYMHQTGPRKECSILQYVTLTLDVYQVCHYITVSVAVSTMGIVLRQAWSQSRRTVLLGYLTISANVKCY